MNVSRGPRLDVMSLVNFIESNEPGTFLSWEKLKEICGVDVKLNPVIISKVRGKLLSKRNNHIPSRFLSSCRKLGYTITANEAVTDQACKWKKKSRNAIVKSFKILSTANLESLDSCGQGKLLSERAKVGCLTIMFKTVESKKVLEATNYRPKISDSQVIRYLLNKGQA